LPANIDTSLRCHRRSCLRDSTTGKALLDGNPEASLSMTFCPFSNRTMASTEPGSERTGLLRERHSINDKHRAIDLKGSS
jgi:hypothetical protein